MMVPAGRKVPLELLAVRLKARLPELPFVARTPVPVMVPDRVVMAGLVTVNVLVPAGSRVSLGSGYPLPPSTAVVLGMLIELLIVILQ